MKITKARFMMNGYKPPSNSRMKKEISIDSISGYFEYTGRDEAKDVVKEVEENETGYFGYTGSHTVGTSSSMATLNTREDRKRFKKEIKKTCTDFQPVPVREILAYIISFINIMN